jgi:hypothetical protein
MRAWKIQCLDKLLSFSEDGLAAVVQLPVVFETQGPDQILRGFFVLLAKDSESLHLMSVKRDDMPVCSKQLSSE